MAASITPEQLQELIEELQRGTKDINEFADALARLSGISENAAKVLAKSIEVHQKSVEQLEKEIALLKQLGEVEEAAIKTKQRQIEKLRQEIAAGADNRVEKEKRIRQLQEEQQGIRNVSRATEDFITTTTGVDDRWKQTLIGSILSGDTKENLKTFADKAKKQLSFENIIGSTMLKIQEATVKAFMEMDAAFSSFAAATGASASYNKVIADTARGNTALGISFQQAGRATTDLFTNLNTFSRLNKSTQEQLVVTTAKLERLGISGGETAKSIASLSMMMGVSERQAAKTVEKFAAMGQTIGVSSKQMISDFNAVKDQLVVFGSSMDKTFTDLAAQAKATGVAVNDLLNLANKFDTFEGAASQVAKLNAVLGGPFLSAMSMIETTDPTERINMLRQAVDNAGMSFESMGYYEKKAIMEAGGFKSVEEAQRILSMSAGAYAKQLKEQEGNQKTLNEAIERSIPIQEKLQLLMANFAIVIEPLVTGLSAVVSKLAEFADTAGGKVVIAALGVLLVLGLLVRMVASLGQAFQAAGGVLNFFKSLVIPATKAAEVGGQATGNGLRSLGTGLAGLGRSVTSVMPQLLVLTLVLLGIGAAVWMIGLGFKALLEGFASVLEQAVKAPVVFLYLAAGVMALGAALSALALNPFIWLGLLSLTKIIEGVAASFEKIDSDKLYNFKVTMEKIVEVSEPATLVGFQQFSEKFEAVAQATANIETSKTQAFANMLIATQNLSQSLKLNQTVIVKIGDKKFEGMIVETVDKIMGDQSTNRVTGD